MVGDSPVGKRWWGSFRKCLALLSVCRKDLFMHANSSLGLRPTLVNVLTTLPSTAVPLQVANKVAKKERKPVAGFELGFTPDNEVFISRMSMLGFGSAVIGEFISGQGVLGQLGYELGLQQVRP